MLEFGEVTRLEVPMDYGDNPGQQGPGEPGDFGGSHGDGAQLPGGGPGRPAARGFDNSGFAKRAMTRARAWSGPLPPPDILGEYERQLPGAAERILAFAMRLTTAMISVSAIFFSLAVARVGNTGAAMAGGSVFLSVPVIMLFRAFITRG
jgi:uncharacterized membrane protein